MSLNCKSEYCVELLTVPTETTNIIGFFSYVKIVSEEATGEICYEGTCIPFENYCLSNEDAANEEITYIHSIYGVSSQFDRNMISRIFQPGYVTSSGYKMFTIPDAQCLLSCYTNSEEVSCYEDNILITTAESRRLIEDQTSGTTDTYTDTETDTDTDMNTATEDSDMTSSLTLISAASVAGAVAVGEIIRSGANHAISAANQFADAGMGVVHAAVGSGMINDVADHVNGGLFDFSPGNLQNMVNEAGNTAADTTIEDVHKVVTDVEAIIRADKIAAMSVHANLDSIKITNVR